MKHILLAYLLVFGSSTCARGADPASNACASRAEAAASLSNAMAQVRGMSLPELRSLLLDPCDESVSLGAVRSDYPPRLWVYEWACDPLRKHAWKRLGLYDPPSADDGFKLWSLGDMTERQTIDCLRRVAAYSRLSETNDQSVWTFLIDRSNKEPTVLDMMVLGKMRYGETFNLEPSGGAADRKNVTDMWGPGQHPSFDDRTQWRCLADGSNCVYRFFSIENMAEWAREDEEPGLIQRALRDDALWIRHTAAALASDLLWGKEGGAILRSHLEWHKSQRYTNALDKVLGDQGCDWVRSMIKDVEKRKKGKKRTRIGVSLNPQDATVQDKSKNP